MIRSIGSHSSSSRRRRLRGAITETLESRRLMCADHTPAMELELLYGATRSATVRSPDWYKPARAATSDAAPAGATGDANPTWITNGAGLPLLTARDSGLKIFLDYDGYGTDVGFDRDGNPATFNAEEQRIIYDGWRDIVSFFAPLDVNVTTVQPALGGSAPAFVWNRIITTNAGPGAAYVNWLTNDTSQGWTNAADAIGRHSGMAHEIGHQLGLNHQAEYDKWGTLTAEYTDGYGVRDRAVIGVDYAENVRGWFYGRNSGNAANLIDDLGVMAGNIAGRVGGDSDGYRVDDHSNSVIGATVIPTATGMTSGIIERNNDADVFRFTSAGGTYQIDATPTYESAVSPKIELLDAGGNIIAARDDADQRNGNNNDQEFSLDLGAGTYYVRVSSSGDYGEQGEYVVTAAPLPTGWTSQDVGAPFRAGTAAFNPTTNTLTQLGGGSDIWTNTDQFRFTSTILNGDGTITARIDSLDDVDIYAKAGVMIRQSLAGNSAHVYLGIRPSLELDPIARNTAGATAYNAFNGNGQFGPWVRIERVGNAFTLSKSADGVNWTVGSVQSIAMSGPVYIGFATNSRSVREAAYAKFSNIAVTGNLGAAAPTYNTLAAPTNLLATAVAAATTGIALSWSAVTDAVNYALERSVDGVNFTTVATLGGTSYTDNGLFGSMRYFYRVAALAVGGSRSVPSASASVVNKPAAPSLYDASYAQAFISRSTTEIFLNWADVQGDNGYRIERSTDGGANFELVTTTPKNFAAYNDGGRSAGTVYLYRITPVTLIAGGAGSLMINASTRLLAASNFTVSARQATATTLTWSDVVGDTGYRLERSTDRATWTSLVTVPGNTTTYTYTGLSPLTSYYYRLVPFNGLSEGMESITFAATTAASSLPAGWTDGDVGAVPGAGAAGNTSSTAWTVLGAGNDIWNAADQFHYVRRTATGNVEIQARIASLENTDNFAKAGVMIRESATAGSRYAFVCVTPGGGISFEYRSDTNVNALKVAGVTGVAPTWLKLVRLNGVFTASYSSDGQTWTPIGSQVIAMDPTVTFGLAVTSHNVLKLATANFDNVSATGATAMIAPTIVTGVKSTPSPVTGTTSVVSVVATDDQPLSGLTYTWDFLSKPATAAAPTFTNNGTNAASTSTATYYGAGNYVIRVTVRDADNLSVTSSTLLTVSAVATTLSITPAAPALTPGGTQAFTASTLDQFGKSMATPATTWSTTRGTIGATGVLSVPTDSGAITVTAVAGGKTASITANIGFAATGLTFNDQRVQMLLLDLNGSVTASAVASALVLTNRTSGITYQPGDLAVSIDAATHRATITLASGAPMADGRYRASIAAGALSDTNGTALSNAVTVDFISMAGDVTGDGQVSFDDLLALAANYGGTDKLFAQGNINRDASGTVDFDDLLMLASRYGNTLPALAAAPLAATTAAPTRMRKTNDVLG